MCNIAGYVGSEQAAPILLEMIEAQEGLAGGYYTGIATIDEGRIHWAKVVGDCAALRVTIDPLDLPGAIGLAHSRSNSGGDCDWSHPFIACADTLAYIANGTRGCFERLIDDSGAARRLLAEGHQFTAVSDEQIGNYPLLPDGGSVHMSDVMAHTIEARLSHSPDPLDAIETAFLDLPSEAVGLFITPQHPRAILGARYNFPMCVGMDASGARVASSPTALAEGTNWWTWVPPCSAAEVRAGAMRVRPLGSPSAAVEDDIDRGDARAAILEALAGGDALSFGALSNAVKPLSGRTEMVAACDPVYEVLHRLETQGTISRETARVDGAQEGLTAPQFRFRLAGGAARP